MTIANSSYLRQLKAALIRQIRGPLKDVPKAEAERIARQQIAEYKKARRG